MFYRTNNSSRAVEDVFIRAGIPYKVVGGVRFYERKEIRDIVAYLRVLDNPGDAVSMRRILNTPRRGIGDRAEACVAVYAENTGASFNDALQAAAEGRVPMLNTRSEKAIAGFVEMLDELRGMLDGELGELVEAVLDRTGYRQRTRIIQRPTGSGATGQPQRTRQRRTRIQHRSGQRGGACARSPTPQSTRTSPTPVCSLQFLERVSLVADADEHSRARLGRRHDDDPAHREGPGVPGGVRHRLGGRHVPAHAGARRPAELSEERRLAYVGITRARQRLYLSRAKVRSSWGQPMLNPESRFLREIPQELIDWRRTERRAVALARPWAARAGSARHARHPARSAARNRPLITLEPGDRVNHDKYGLGRVEEVSGVGESAMSLIDFGSAGRVKLMHNHAPVSQALNM